MNGPRAKESNLWNWLRKAEQHFGNRLHWHRIENLLERGTPDVEGCLDGMGFVLELKSVARRPSGDVWCELKTEQAQFLLARCAAGGSAWILVQVGVSSDAARYLVNGAWAKELLEPVPESRLKKLSHASTATDIVMTIGTEQRTRVTRY